MSTAMPSCRTLRTKTSAAVLTATLGVTAACSGDGNDGGAEPECLDRVELDCNALFGVRRGSTEIAPTFDEIFTNILKPTCGAAGCHDARGAAGGLVFEDVDDSYAQLLGPGSDGRFLVQPGSPECSKLMVRLEVHGQPWSMPPGRPLDEPRLCVIRHWIANGAEHEP